MKLWKQNGKLLKNENGHLIKCDDCPCGGCSGQPTTITVDNNADAGVATCTLSSVPTCTTFSLSNWNTRVIQCFWNGTFVGGSDAGRTCIVATEPGALSLPASWEINVYAGICGLPPTILGHALPTRMTPIGVYTDYTIT